MDFKYKWKNGRPPNRDVSARETNLLDESQFETEQDQQIAEEQARQHLGLPKQTLDKDSSILPKAAPPQDKPLK
ncbi:hypothetical protein [Gloeothece verrucosa]|uniref:Bromodomain-containing protein n=1 Tax=Gloeothece verrucosa (strain PCC 7822) TaxID=497965 RepID=E0U6S2_GLOV7|nr:hypothetical protein [Gloeothece verrucosa]ADN14831.1 bromodomain-containing protein [Gloeothece verrucosa PCC 7822]